MQSVVNVRMLGDLLLPFSGTEAKTFGSVGGNNKSQKKIELNLSFAIGKPVWPLFHERADTGLSGHGSQCHDQHSRNLEHFSEQVQKWEGGKA